MIDQEIWLSCLSPFSAYDVSNLGRVRRRASLRLLTPVANAKGYLSVCLQRDDGNGHKTPTIHRLAAFVFLGPPPDASRSCVDHIDGDKANNCSDNLRWCSRRENTGFAVANGRHRGKDKKPRVYKTGKRPKAILTDVLVREILSRVGTISLSKMAKQYGISQTALSNIVNGRTWRHITGLPKYQPMKARGATSRSGRFQVWASQSSPFPALVAAPQLPPVEQS